LFIFHFPGFFFLKSGIFFSFPENIHKKRTKSGVEWAENQGFTVSTPLNRFFLLTKILLGKKNFKKKSGK
jgi:hypothetical protein